VKEDSLPTLLTFVLFRSIKGGKLGITASVKWLGALLLRLLPI